ncbi:MAG: hypothetical protein QXR60_04410 [Candidatus Nanoarchaeia archaeon]
MAIKWETYVRLSPFQQKEWEFKFKNNQPPKVPFSDIVVLTCFFMIMSSYLLVMLLLPDKFGYNHWIVSYVWWLKLCVVMIFIWSFSYTADLLIFFWKLYKEKMWLKSLGNYTPPLGKEKVQ